MKQPIELSIQSCMPETPPLSDERELRMAQNVDDLGQLQWQALIRLLDRKDPSYRD